jgi:hypothetical protein
VLGRDEHGVDTQRHHGTAAVGVLDHNLSACERESVCVIKRNEE